jgi:hypothetical protein
MVAVLAADEDTSGFEGSINGSTQWIVQVNAKEEAPLCGAFAEPSDGLEPSNEAGTAGKAGKPRARKSRKKKESPEDE